MSHELAEQMEHAAHEAHAGGHEKAGGASLSKMIGMTMAGLGVILAFCSAMVGGARSSMIATMVKQTDASNKYLTIATKYRLIESQLQEMHALLPTDSTGMKKAEGTLTQLEKQAGKSPNGTVIKAIHLQTAQVLSGAIPTRSDVLRFADMVETYGKEKEAAQERAESFDPRVEAYTESAEHYEWAQLMAEFGIVLASVALLFANRILWGVSLVFGLGSLSTIVWTTTSAHAALNRAEARINDAEDAYKKAAQDKADGEFDEKLVEEVEHLPKW